MSFFIEEYHNAQSLTSHFSKKRNHSNLLAFLFYYLPNTNIYSIILIHKIIYLVRMVMGMVMGMIVLFSYYINIPLQRKNNNCELLTLVYNRWTMYLMCATPMSFCQKIKRNAEKNKNKIEIMGVCKNHKKNANNRIEEQHRI